MGIIAWIIFGLVVGVIAKLIMPGKDPGGFIVTILLGVAGALVGGFIGSLFGVGGIEGFSAISLILAVVGAVLLLWAYRAMSTRRGHHAHP